jgi:4-hydroxybenzoate polyprenyltransferase
MNARHKLNRAHLLATVCIAAFFGAATQSWAIFLLVGAALVGGLIYSGNIRFDQRRRR